MIYIVSDYEIKQIKIMIIKVKYNDISFFIYLCIPKASCDKWRRKENWMRAFIFINKEFDNCVKSIFIKKTNRINNTLKQNRKQ